MARTETGPLLRNDYLLPKLANPVATISWGLSRCVGSVDGRYRACAELRPRVIAELAIFALDTV